MSRQHAVVLVDSTSHALYIEKLVKAKGFECKLIPVPRHLSSDCGVCVRVFGEDAGTIERLLQEANIQFQAIEAV